MKGSLGIDSPFIDKLMQHIVVQLDIIHRGGKVRKGQSVVVSDDSLSDLRDDILAFVDGIEEN